MNNLTSQQRKLVYVAGMLVLLIPIIWLGLPADSVEGSGGRIAQLRRQYDLGESDLGKIDPTGTAMSLVLVGLRGVAANILWSQAEDQKNHKDWAAMRATTEQIIRLQPHYVKVWDYNGWNLAFNVSAEWDAVPDRYFWVKEGGKFLQQGVARNTGAPDLYWKAGDIYGRKVGYSDEAKFFRRYYRKDPDPRFNGSFDPTWNPRDEDNYLTAKEWFTEANKVEGQGKKKQTIMDRTIFRSYPARAQLDYASALYKYGFEEEYLREVGDQKLSDEALEATATRIREQLRETTRAAWERGFEDWTKGYGGELFPIDYLGKPVELRLEMTAEDIQSMGKTPEGIAHLQKAVDQYQKINNYRYWRTLALCESEPDTAEAHWSLFAATEQFRKQNLEAARKFALQSMTLFEKIADKYPDLGDQDMFLEEGVLAVHIWQQVYFLQAEKAPDTFPFKKYWDSKQHLLPEVIRRFQQQNRAAER